MEKVPEAWVALSVIVKLNVKMAFWNESGVVVAELVVDTSATGIVGAPLLPDWAAKRAAPVPEVAGTWPGAFLPMGSKDQEYDQLV
jgi:hypothetical protein